MATRPTSTPPELPGYRPISHLGSGGFADVFLYQQELPSREVAVKVLIDSAVDDGTRRRFVAEANNTARLSAHPSIVTIYFAGVAADGRPCLVMEYCPRPNLGVRMRQERMPVAEALRLGIRLASAVETAHRAGILHRDIKPANVLVTAYGGPKLTDFGISAQLEGHTAAAEGMSVPWSPPELFLDQPQSDVRTDVYSLGATIYAMLAGRPPFEIPGGHNAASAMIDRIERQPVPPIGREDVPLVLEQTLQRAMHKRSEARHRSAYDFAAALQLAQSELGLGHTEIEVLESFDDEAQAGDDPAATRLRPVTTISDEPGWQLADEHTHHSGGTSGSSQGSINNGAMRHALDPLPDLGHEAPRVRVVPIVLGLIALVAVIAVVVGVVLFGPNAPGVDKNVSSQTPGPVVRQIAVPPPTNGKCTRTGRQLVCQWDPPTDANLVAGWTWQLTANPSEVRGSVNEPKVTVTLPTETTAPCISVTAFNTSGATSDPVPLCAN